MSGQIPEVERAETKESGRDWFNGSYGEEAEEEMASNVYRICVPDDWILRDGSKGELVDVKCGVQG